MSGSTSVTGSSSVSSGMRFLVQNNILMLKGQNKLTNKIETDLQKREQTDSFQRGEDLGGLGEKR